MDSSSLNRPSYGGRVIPYLKASYERFAFHILLAWCLLPAVVAVIYFITAALGKFPSEEELRLAGLTLGKTNYVVAVKTYQALFFILGVPTLLFALMCLAWLPWPKRQSAPHLMNVPHRSYRSTMA